MSIQPGRVLGRIVDEVAREPRLVLPRESFSHADFRGVPRGQVLEVVRSGDPRDARLASLFHFWAHGLRNFLERLGSRNQLQGAAGYGMCESISGVEWRARLDALSHSLSLSDPSDRDRAEDRDRADPARARVWCPPVSMYREAYLMIDGSCRRSAVAGTDGGVWLAYYWAHGFEVQSPLVLASPE